MIKIKKDNFELELSNASEIFANLQSNDPDHASWINIEISLNKYEFDYLNDKNILTRESINNSSPINLFGDSIFFPIGYEHSSSKYFLSFPGLNIPSQNMIDIVSEVFENEDSSFAVKEISRLERRTVYEETEKLKIFINDKEFDREDADKLYVCSCYEEYLTKYHGYISAKSYNI